MKAIDLLFLISTIILGAFNCHAQNVEFSEIHWGDDDRVCRKMHVKEEIPLVGKSVEEIHDIVESWYTKTLFEKGKVYTYRLMPENGQVGWFRDRRYKLYVDQTHRIWTRNVKCEDCFLIRWTRKKDVTTDGYYQMDIRMKDDALLLVISDFYVVKLNDYLANLTTRQIAETEREKARFAAVETLFQVVKQDLTEFIDDLNRRGEADK